VNYVRLVIPLIVLLIGATACFGQEPEAAADVGGFFSFVNVIWVFVGVLFLIAAIGLFGQYIAPLIENTPPVVLEIAGYAVSGALVFGSPHYFGPIASFIMGIIGIPVFAVAAAYRAASFSSDDSWGRGLLVVLIGFTGAAALYHNSQFLGGLSAMLLMWLFGSWVFPLYEGFKDDSGQIVPSAFWGSSATLVGTAALALTLNPPWLYVFKPGVLWLAGLGCSSGLLILSCRYYYGGGVTLSWVFWQGMAVLAGVCALFLGHTYHSVLGTTVLQEIGATFLATFLAAKIIEIPWDLNYWPWLALCAAAGAYMAVNFASKHPDYFLAF